MGILKIDRRRQRKGLFIQKLGNSGNPSLLFPLENVERSELDELVRGILAKGGITVEAEVQAVLDKAEQDYEVRVKISEAKAEVRRLMALRRQGLRLMQVGYRKWKETFFPPVHHFKVGE